MSFSKNLNQNRKAVSAVIATVVIVAMAIGVAIAYVYWIGGLATIFTIDPYTQEQEDPSPTGTTMYSKLVFLGQWIIDDYFFNGIYEGYFVIGHRRGYPGGFANIYVSVEYQEFRLGDYRIVVLEYWHDCLFIKYWEI